MDTTGHSPGGNGQSGVGSSRRKISLAEIETADETFRLRRRNLVPLNELVDDLRARGQQQPVDVVEAGSRFRVLDGFRRLAAAGMLGWRDIDARIHPPLPAEAARELAFSANVVRSGMSVAERAVAIGLARREGFDKLDIVRIFSISRRQAERYLAMSDEIIECIERKLLTMAHARVLARLGEALPAKRIPVLAQEIHAAAVSATDLPRWLADRGFVCPSPARKKRVVGAINDQKVRLYASELTAGTEPEARRNAVAFFRRAIELLESFEASDLPSREEAPAEREGVPVDADELDGDSEMLLASEDHEVRLNGNA